ncbi:D-alanyl-D-alanine carboxypeptidase family protein [Shimazuella kribbensis]|uniref:D-alanyl-D-alanine carboxypeptidase family protein n=1 Tax=Shimazuella kribbensis TaxID=139808 RepID=UPI00040CE463|nr:D-alanyl-D-alanine carboxypeptidase family protein [Shimazuella kribbensis]
MKKHFSMFLLTMSLSLLILPVSGFAQSNAKIFPQTPFEDEIVDSPKEKQSMFKGQNTEESTPTEPTQNGTEPDIEAESYLLKDYESGIILAQKNQNHARPPASITKMMTAYVVLDKIKNGELHWTDEVIVSKRAADVNEAQIFLQENEKITIKELFTGLMVQSANDAAVALAEHVAGSEEAFVELMNQKAKNLGLENTHFLNCSGLNQEDYPDPPDTQGEHVMSAEDIVQLGNQLMAVHPEIFDFTTIATYTFHSGTTREQKVNNWNSMLPGLKHEYEGVQGIKTGSTQLAGFCFAGTVKREQTRFISVVMGTKSKDKRFTETKKLYDYGYSHFKRVTFLEAGQSVPQHRSVTVANAKKKRQTVVIAKNIHIPVPVQIKNKKDYSYQVKVKNNLKAPLKKGTIVGMVELYFKGHKIEGFKPIPIVTKDAVKEANFFDHISDLIAS